MHRYYHIHLLLQSQTTGQEESPCHHKSSPCFIHGKEKHNFSKDLMHNYSKNARERINTALIKDRENAGNIDLNSINGQNEISEKDFKLNSIGK